jgi:hypothetical protein
LSYTTLSSPSPSPSECVAELYYSTSEVSLITTPDWSFPGPFVTSKWLRLSDRRILLRFNGLSADPLSLLVGTQGSPISPILSIFYTSQPAAHGYKQRSAYNMATGTASTGSSEQGSTSSLTSPNLFSSGDGGTTRRLWGRLTHNLVMSTYFFVFHIHNTSATLAS